MAHVSHLKRVATALFRAQTAGALEPYHAIVSHLAANQVDSIQERWDQYYDEIMAQRKMDQPCDNRVRCSSIAAETYVDAQITPNLFDAFLEADLDKPMLDRYLRRFLNPTETGWKAPQKQFSPSSLPSLRQLLRECIDFSSHYTPSYRLIHPETVITRYAAIDFMMIRIPSWKLPFREYLYNVIPIVGTQSGSSYGRLQGETGWKRYLTTEMVAQVFRTEQPVLYEQLFTTGWPTERGIGIKHVAYHLPSVRLIENDTIIAPGCRWIPGPEQISTSLLVHPEIGSEKPITIKTRTFYLFGGTDTGNMMERNIEKVNAQYGRYLDRGLIERLEFLETIFGTAGEESDSGPASRVEILERLERRGLISKEQKYFHQLDQ